MTTETEADVRPCSCGGDHSEPNHSDVLDGPLIRVAYDFPGEHEPYFPDMRRVVETDGSGSWIEPHFDESWPALVQLRWQAAALRVDAQVQVSVNELEPGRFGLSWVSPGVGGGMSSEPFHETWSTMSAMRAGVHVHDAQNPQARNVLAAWDAREAAGERLAAAPDGPMDDDDWLTAEDGLSHAMEELRASLGGVR